MTNNRIAISLTCDKIAELNQVAKKLDMSRPRFLKKLCDYVLAGNLDISPDEKRLVKNTKQNNLIFPPQGWVALTPNEQARFNVSLSKKNAPQ